jgi:sulfatase maturation enzyme AslB (radical SAM superfamily)
MGDFCSGPWKRLGIVGCGQYSCCLANLGSLCLPNKFSREITTRSFQKDQILWKIWNSHLFQESRYVMSIQGIKPTCGVNDDTCSVIYKLPLVPLSDLQKINIEKMQENIENKNIEVTHYPPLLDLTLDGICNLKCKHCLQRLTGDYGTPYLPIENFKDELLEFCKRAIYITLTGGEPTIAKNYDMTLDIIQEAKGGRIDLVTNGHFLIQKVIPKINLFHNFFISVDAASSQVYSEVRPGNSPNYNFDRLLVNLSKLKQTKERYRTFITTFVFVINGYNYHEIPEMIYLAKEYGADNIKMVNAWNLPYKYDKKKILWCHSNPEAVRKKLDLAIENAKILDIPLMYCFDYL